MAQTQAQSNGGQDRKAHTDVDLNNFWRKQVLTFNQTGVFPHKGKHSFPAFTSGNER